MNPKLAQFIWARLGHQKSKTTDHAYPDHPGVDRFGQHKRVIVTDPRCYEDGDGVEQNYTLAANWYRKVAEHVPDLGGAGQGRNQLGLLYLQGLGVPKDYIQAYMWFSLAGTERNLAAVQVEMNAAQILQAQQMADEWKKLHPDPAIY